MSAPPRRAAALVIILALAAAVLLTPPALAAQPDYSGTYVGTATTDKGVTVPVTIIFRDDGATTTMSMISGKWSVKAVSPENWVNDTTLKLTPEIDADYLGILSGTGEITLVLADTKWTGTGTGEGTALAAFSGSGSGQIQMLTRAFDTERAAQWHKDNPVPAAQKPAAEPSKVVTAVSTAARPLSPERELPISAEEKVLSAGIIVFAFLILFLLILLYGPFSPMTLAVWDGSGAAD